MWPYAVLLFAFTVWISRAMRTVAIRAAILAIDLILIPLKAGGRVFGFRDPALRKTA